MLYVDMEVNGVPLKVLNCFIHIFSCNQLSLTVLRTLFLYGILNIRKLAYTLLVTSIEFGVHLPDRLIYHDINSLYEPILLGYINNFSLQNI
jgi:hypothetical protein